MRESTSSTSEPSGRDIHQAVKDINGYIERGMAQWQVPGLAMVVVKGQEVICARGFGVKKLGEAEPVDEKTLFQIGSVTKSFTAALVAMLVDEEKMTWDSRVREFLPDFQLYCSFTTRELTVSDLMSHRTGFEDHGGDLLWYLFRHPTDELVHRIRYLKPAYGLRERFRYNNILWVVAGKVVETITGRSWSDLVKKRIFAPLGMVASATGLGEIKDTSCVATPHGRPFSDLEHPFQPIPLGNFDAVGPAGSVFSNAEDMAAWVRIHLGQGKCQGRHLISSENLREMHNSQTVIRPGDMEHTDLYAWESNFVTYGLGWFLNDYAGRKVISHGGNTDGMTALVGLMPEEEIGVVILTNLHNNMLPWAIMNELFDITLNQSERDWSSILYDRTNALWEKEPAGTKEIDAVRLQGATMSLPLECYTGTFQNEMYGQVHVLEKKGQLELRLGPNGITGRLEHWHGDVFMLSLDSPFLDRLYITYRVGINGEMDLMELKGSGLFPVNIILTRRLRGRTEGR